MAPSTMKAIKIVEAGKAEIQSVPVPHLRDDYVLVKVEAIALNPTDWKVFDHPVSGFRAPSADQHSTSTTSLHQEQPWDVILLVS